LALRAVFQPLQGRVVMSMAIETLQKHPAASANENKKSEVEYGIRSV
jgi:hypothetical protein